MSEGGRDGMRYIKGKNIVLGVSGGIAAYKSAELLRLIKKQDANARVIMTKNASAFVGSLTFEALSGNPVCTDLFEKGEQFVYKAHRMGERSGCSCYCPGNCESYRKACGRHSG